MLLSGLVLEIVGDFIGVFQSVDKLEVYHFDGFSHGGERVSHLVQLLYADAARFGYGFGVLTPEPVEIYGGLQPVGFAHVVEQERFHSAFECSDFHHLHFHAEFVEQSLEERNPCCKAFEADFTYGIEENFVGSCSYVIIALAVGVAVSHNPFS